MTCNEVELLTPARERNPPITPASTPLPHGS
jgi:hypothetical protein